MYFVDDLELSPLACAYARARGADRMSSYGDWIALSDVCDEATATLIASGRCPTALSPPATRRRRWKSSKRKRKGSYNVVEIDPRLRARGAWSTRMCFGVTFEQGRNELEIDEDACSKTSSPKTRTCPQTAKRDLLISLITLKYTQSNSVCYAKDGQAIGVGAGQQSPHPLHAPGRQQGRHLAAAPASEGAGPAVQARHIRRPDRDNTIDVYISDE